MKHIFALFLLLLICYPCGIVYGAESAEQEKVFAIQNRIFHRNHELTLNAGYIPDEDFYHAFPFGLSYTYNFNEHFGWEVARGQWIVTTEKDLLDTLVEQFAAQPSEFNKPQYMLHSHLVYKPLYGKAAVLNRGIVNHETYLFVGGGFINYEKQFPAGHPDHDNPPTENVPSFSLGVGTKYFINESLCINFELRDMVNFWDNNTDNRIYFGIGLGWRFNLRPRQEEKDQSVEKLKEYLRKQEGHENQ